MKKILLASLFLFIVTPVYSVPNWVEGANDNVKFYDDSEIQAYGQKLEDDFHKKYNIQISPTHSRYIGPMNGYDKEVISPLYEYSIKHPPKYNYD